MDSTESKENSPTPISSKISWPRPDGFGDTPGYIFGDETSTAGVIVMQEWWGVTEEIKSQAAKIAAAGYRCVVPDLYRGSIGLEAEEAHHLMTSLDWPMAVVDITGAAQYLLANGCQKVGIIGFCMGGALALAGAILVNEIDCAAPFYGIPEPALCDPINCRKPIQAHFGELDTHESFSDPTAANALKERLQTAGCQFEVIMYPNAGHAFMNELPESLERQEKMGMPPENAEARERAWNSVFEFFGAKLKDS
mmetsp:Transcript_30191/g.39783  ORF Transcript_30191/g.39783 Transcript_30191/m.39783 type:complete len:252 (+) Transcript_30191:190-945(+)